jgi:hypothetical protein
MQMVSHKSRTPLRHYYCKSMLKMSDLFMSPCNESLVALWLWFCRRWVILSVMIRNSQPFFKLCGCEICTSERLRCACVLYVVRDLHASCQALYHCEFVTTTSAFCFGLLLHNSVAMSHVTVWNNAGDASLSFYLFRMGEWGFFSVIMQNLTLVLWRSMATGLCKEYVFCLSV